jgi:flagellar M-ring protein FliF
LPLKTIFDGLDTRKKISFIFLAALILAGFVYLLAWIGSPEMRPLYSNLSSQDAGMIVEQLKADKIPYEVASGNTIRVPVDRVFETTMTMASRGLPQGGGVGFEIFDNPRLGMTEFEQNVNYQRALQGELARTIGRFPAIQGCRVHIVMPTESIFVEQEKPASASVILDLFPGKQLHRKEIQGIVHLVSASVPGLSPNQITIVDGNGNMLSAAGIGGGMGQGGGDYLAHQQQVEQKLGIRVKTMLDEVLGPGKSIVRVSCELDYRKQEVREETYDPEKVARSEQVSRTTSTDTAEAAAGVPGVLSNMTDAGREDSGPGGQTAFQKQETTANYEISKITRHTIDPVGEIRRISVAVIVDGTRRATGSDGGAGEPGEPVYVPRTDAEMTALTKIVQRAVNFNPERGDQVDVVNIPFVKGAPAGRTEPAGWRKALDAVKPFVPAFLILLFLIFVARPLVRWMTRTPAVDSRLLKQLPMTVGEMEKEYKEPKQLPVSDELTRAVSMNKDQTVQYIREWMKEQK